MGSAFCYFNLISPFVEWKFYAYQQLSDQREARFNFLHIEPV